MSYVIDVYRREQAAVRDIADYALYISFFRGSRTHCARS
jgi:hypothetical protein